VNVLATYEFSGRALVSIKDVELGQ